MFWRQQVPVKQRPYDEMRTYITHRRYSRTRRWWWLSRATTVGIVVGGLSSLLNPASGSLFVVLVLAFLHGSLGFVLILLSIFFGNSLEQTDTEQKVIGYGEEFLNQKVYGPHIIETIEKRAQVGLGMGQIRSLIAILFLPIVATFAAAIIVPIFLKQISITPFVWNPYWMGGALVVAVVGLGFFEAINRSNIDAAILSAIAEYGCEQRQQEINTPPAGRSSNGQGEPKHLWLALLTILGIPLVFSILGSRK